jgi:hypothetical protein
MPANYLDKWDILASPTVLLDPIIATVVAARGLNRAIKLGAKTLIDARMVWAFGPRGLDIPKTSAEYTKRLESEQKRLRSLGFLPTLALAPIESFRLDAFGTGPQIDQVAKSDQIQGHDPPSVKPKKSGVLPLILGLALWGLS